MGFMGNSAQKEQLKAIGTRLGEERQKKSISLEEIAAKTYIPQRLLNAIEDGNLDRLPEPVFVQGFIRRYGDALGLDGTVLSKEFTVDLSPLPAAATLISSSPEPPLKPAVQSSMPPKPAPAPMTPLPALKTPEPVMIRDEPKLVVDQPPARLPLIALAGAIGLGVIGILAATLFNRPAERSTPVATSAPVTEPSQAPITPPSPVASTPASPAPAGTVGVKMNVIEDSWVEVVVDGNSVFEGTLPKGTQRTWNGKKQVVVNAGNAGGVALSYNNAPFKPMGTTGEVQSATLPPTP
jgi:cytoskeletal protein RodZ